MAERLARPGSPLCVGRDDKASGLSRSMERRRAKSAQAVTFSPEQAQESRPPKRSREPLTETRVCLSDASIVFMFKFAIPAVAALGLIAVAAQSRATDSTPEAYAAAPAMGWHLSHEDSMAKLAYGVANSDQLALMMTCEPGQAQAVVYGDVHPASPRLVKASMTAGAIDPLSGGLADEARIALEAPVLQKLVHSGKLAVEGDAGHFELTATGDEQRLVREFFAYCGSDTV